VGAKTFYAVRMKRLLRLSRRKGLSCRGLANKSLIGDEEEGTGLWADVKKGRRGGEGALRGRDNGKNIQPARPLTEKDRKKPFKIQSGGSFVTPGAAKNSNQRGFQIKHATKERICSHNTRDIGHPP